MVADLDPCSDGVLRSTPGDLTAGRPGHDAVRAMSSLELELAALKFLDGLSGQLKDVREPHKALRYGLRDACEFFGASQGCIAALRAGRSEADLLFTLPKRTEWNGGVLTPYISPTYPPVPPDMLIGSVRRRGGLWGAMALIATDRAFDRDDRRLMTRVAAVVSEAVHRIDRDRLLDVRERVDRKLMEQIHPKDLFYQILDGIRSLTLYDHSSALFIREEDDSSLRLVAEQIAWTKAKSERIGHRIPLNDEAAALLQSERVYGFDRHGDTWREWSGQPAGALAALLDYNRAADGSLREASMLCAPLVTRESLIGVLKIAARHSEQLTVFDAELVEHFRSQAAIAIQNLHRTESLRARVVAAERKHAMADLARSVSHDLNNALGSMLPLIQQMQADVSGERLAPEVFAEDLEHVQKSLQVCRRIFGGMLTFSRNAARRSGHGHVRRAIDTASAILKYGMSRSAIELQVNVPDDIPEVACSQSDLEQVFLNLLSNAREATLQGGRITISAQGVGGLVEIAIADTGCGIRAEDLQRVLEPFFTTKAQGSGLGLSICRSVLWEVDGTLTIQSTPGRGTDVRVRVPAAPQLQPV
jgi:two-component system, NtrC family, sensor kinase